MNFKNIIKNIFSILFNCLILVSCTKDDLDDFQNIYPSTYMNLNQTCKLGKMSEKTIYHGKPQFVDNFGKNVSGECYDRKPSCMGDMSHFIPHRDTNCSSGELTDAKYKQLQLKYLNKCIWHIFDGFSIWIKPENHDPKKATVYRSDFVSIQHDAGAEDQSALVLKAGFNPSYDSDPNKQNCGLDPNRYPTLYNPTKDRGWGNWSVGKNCVNATGQIYSSYYDEERPGINKYLKPQHVPSSHQNLPPNIKSKFTRYGRYEVRAKVNGKKFIFPAYWMLPDYLLSGRENGVNLKDNRASKYVSNWEAEIDIWESSFDSSQGKKGFQSYHYWGPDYHASSHGDIFLDQTKKYYTYGMEWRPIKGDENKLEPRTEVLFFVEDCILHKIQDGDMGRDSGLEKKMKSPIYPMTLILGAIIPGALMDHEYYKKNGTNYYEEIWIDWVKVFQ